MKRICLTIDVEDWFQTVIFRDLYPIKTWKDRKIMIEEPLNFLLKLFEKFDIKCTFFVLGWFAENYPNIVECIYNKGHEIASHGMTHTPNNRLTYGEMHYEISKSKNLLEKIIHERILGYRAPSYSINEKMLEFTLRNGYKYDSSFFPVKGNGLYGKVDKRLIENFEAEGLREFSIPTGNFLGKNIPFAGGTYFRFLPLWYIKKQIIKSNNQNIILYFHPGDFDTRLSKWEELPIKYRIRHCMGIKGNDKKFIELLKWLIKENFKFNRLMDLL